MLATIGYENADLADFIETLHLGGIQVLIDIRDRAQSRRPGFSKTALSEALARSGIGYVHHKKLGDPKEGRDAARSGEFDRFRQIFSEVMRSDGAQIALREVADVARTKRICLMCFERDEKTCHRMIVADHLKNVLDTEITHLGVRKGAAGKSTPRRVRHTDQGAAA